MEETPTELCLQRRRTQRRVSRPSSLSPPNPTATTMSPFEDYIGCESCNDMVPLTHPIGTARETVLKAQSMHVIDRRVKDGDYPPPISSLARTENLLSRMPWTMRRLRTTDGRLILRQEKVRYHEYFTAQRSGGRLTLQLVPLEDDGFHLPIVDPETDDTEEGIQPALENEDTLETVIENAAVCGTGGGGDLKCLYSPVSTNSSCLFGVAVHALGPVLG